MFHSNKVNSFVAVVFLFMTFTLSSVLFVQSKDVSAACPLIPTPTGVFPSAPYSNAMLECMLRNGEETAITWDRSNQDTDSNGVRDDTCRDDFRRNAAVFGGNIRAMINGYDDSGTTSPYGKCSYDSAAWVSERYIPNASMPIARAYGTNSIPLQINYVKFINGPLVAPDFNGAGGWSAIYNDLTRWSSTANGANDTAPNAIGTSGQKPAHVESRSYIENLTVSGTFPGMTLSTGWKGATLSGSRAANPGSRFWFARSPVPLTLNIPGGITGSGTIYIDMDYRRADGVFKDGGGSFEYLTACVGTPDYTIWGSGVNFSNLDLCEVRRTRLTISVVLTNNFTLNPSIAVDKATAQQGDTVTATGTVTKAGPTASYDDTNARVTRLIYAPGTAPTQVAGTSASDPCTYYTGETSCDTNYIVRPVSAMSAASNPIGSRGEVIGALAPGTSVCYVSSVTRYNYTGSPPWRHSNAMCTIIAAVPRVAVVGGDVASGGDFACGTTNGGFKGRAGASPGSFTEYGILTAPGAVNSFWSAGSATSKSLTFANAPGATSGGYSGSRCVTNLEPSLTSGVTYASYGGGGIPAAGSYRVSSDITITGSSNISGGPRLIVADAGRTVNITGNITYSPGPYNRFADVPNVIIIADRIRIAAGVTQVDGLFIARNLFSTCTEAGDTIAAVQAPAGIATLTQGGTCRANQLLVKGAVISNGTILTTRSKGGENAGVAPAEIFTMRPDVFLGQYERGISGSILKTDFESELPPRN